MGTANKSINLYARKDYGHDKFDYAIFPNYPIKNFRRLVLRAGGNDYDGAFMRDEVAYCREYGLDETQRDAVRRRDFLSMIEAGGNIYYLAKLAGIFGLSVQDLGAQQAHVSVEAFRARLQAAGT